MIKFKDKFKQNKTKKRHLVVFKITLLQIGREIDSKASSFSKSHLLFS